MTRGGVCEPTFRYGVQIADGTVIDGGGMATVQGRVTRTGAVKVIVRSGNQWANGSGRLSRTVAAACGGARRERYLPRHLGGRAAWIGNHVE